MALKTGFLMSSKEKNGPSVSRREDVAQQKYSQSQEGNTDVVSRAINVFGLEDTYPISSDVFQPFLVEDIRGGDSIVILDTSTLLLPYNIKQDDITALQGVYRLLANSSRLKIPARAAREFIKNRDSKLADLLHALNDQKARLQIPNKRLSPLLDSVPGHSDLVKSQEALVEARKNYDRDLNNVIDRLKSWRGNDPVTSLYNELFSKENIVESSDSRDDLIKEWSLRSERKVPPGYKDSNKDDSGIGDFLIWKSILHEGSISKKDCVFVTGEEKADWFVRSNRDGIFARPELIDEYRRASEGKSVEIISLADLLKFMDVENNIVEEIRNVEAAISSQISAREARNVENWKDASIRPSDLRRATRDLFPGRRSAGIANWKAFRNELITAGYKDTDEVIADLIRGVDLAISSEGKSQSSMYFVDVGMAREAIGCARPEFKEIMGSITPGVDFDLDEGD